MKLISKIKQNLFSLLTEIYVAIIVIIYPLIVDSTGFFKILECKYRYFVLISVTYVALMLILVIYNAIFDKDNIKKSVKFGKVQIAILAFLFLNVISCMLSPYFKEYNLFVGIGRGEGLISIALYSVSFLLISMFGRFNKRYIFYFVISSILISSICIIQYIGFNPFNMYQDGIGTHNVSFIGTIGNVDFVSAMYTIMLTLSVSVFVFLDTKKYFKILCLISIYFGFFIFEVLDVLSGAVGFALTLILVLPYIITNSKRLYRLLIIISTILLGYITNLILNPVYHYDKGMLTLDVQFNLIALILIILTAVIIFLAFVLRKYVFFRLVNRKLIKYMYISMMIIAFIGIIIMLFVDMPFGIFHEIHEIMHGNLNDEFGTYRMFLWKRAFTIFKDYPLIGTGPDSFTARFMDKFTQDVISLGELTINDTAANVYLTMLVNIGILGLISYIVFVGLLLYRMITKRKAFSNVLLIPIICFLIQDFFNLWTVIVTPVFFVLMAIGYISTNLNKEENVYEKK